MGLWIVAICTFILMEPVAWCLHRYVMHGPLWSWHQDHHQPLHKNWQKNDRFILFFAFPSTLAMASDLWWCFGLGLGILGYGLVYGLMHEIIIHRRFPWWRWLNWYTIAIIHAHRDHHKVTTKVGAVNFGMLWVPLFYFKNAWRKSVTGL